MGSGNWFKTIISLKKVKFNASKRVKGSSTAAKSNGCKEKNWQKKESVSMANGSFSRNHGVLAIQDENLAATRIQAAFRAYLARKIFHRMKGTVRLQNVTLNYSVKKQAVTTLSYLHSWSKIQAHIRARRHCMVTEGRMRQKKLEDQLKLEAKLHDLEVEWCGGSETMEETLAKIQQREEAAVKRERAMAYAFSHQWRANSSQYLGLNNCELGKSNWGWSWKERWIAARPWEIRIPAKPISPKKLQNKQASNVAKNINSPAKKLSKPLPVAKPSISTPVKKPSPKPSLPNGKGNAKARKLSYPPAEKPAASRVSAETEEEKPERETIGVVVSNQ
ncbi:putative calmodulin binding protein [Tripterygium wilfordii]|uniref:Putative calmodulin binding protein n=1 Tax=Tripterygium wilfordii TaxID=458696 RepID=A0A7J7C3K5_TRIWF|nr:protein IQ-DOMAIN 1 [Tripterygium wilfordii]XP_038690020.1 protein IQ-DOMAIN 1 [Tripterygium wilfordii]KAF5728712.1 putative calmodulin binding protein [Tripterygium wilfordii]